MTRHVTVTVTHRPARPWWVLPMPHVSGLTGVVVLTLWLSIAAIWYPVVLGVFVVKYAAQGVSQLAASYSLPQPQPQYQPQFWPPPQYQPQPPMDLTAPVWTHQQIVDGLPPRVREDFATRG
jgi:transglutaminase-like putative cysteine protease